MPESNSPNAYPQSREFMEQLADAGRLAIGPMTKSRAHKFRMQCYTLRRNEQRRNAKVYPEGHPMHGASEWDSMSLRVEHHPTHGQGPAEYFIIGTNEGDLSEFQLLDPSDLGDPSHD